MAVVEVNCFDSEDGQTLWHKQLRRFLLEPLKRPVVAAVLVVGASGYDVRDWFASNAMKKPLRCRTRDRPTHLEIPMCIESWRSVEKSGIEASTKIHKH